MATYYCSSVSGDNTTGASWATAKTTLAGAMALATASGDIVYVDSAHSETLSANQSYDAPTADTYIAVLSVNRNGSTGTGHSGWLAGASAQVSQGNSFTLDIASARSQSLYLFGLYVAANSGSSSSNSIRIGNVTGAFRVTVVAASCTLSTPGSSNAAALITGANSTTRPAPSISLYDCTLIAANTSNSAAEVIAMQACDLFIADVTISFGGASKPPVLIRPVIIAGNATFIDSDLSGYNATGAFVDAGAFYSGGIEFVNCKLDSTPAKSPSGTWAGNSAYVLFLNCSATDTKATFEYYTRLGTVASSTSVHASSGFQHDATSMSWLVTTTAACNEAEPFRFELPTRWISSASAQTFTVEYVRDSANTMNDRQIWAEFERVFNASFPQGTLQSVRNATPFDGSGSNWGAGAATWTGTGGSATTGKLTSGSVTPAEKSILRTWINVAVASITDLYIDPAPRIA